MSESDINLYGERVSGYSIPLRNEHMVGGDAYTRQVLVCTDPRDGLCLDHGGLAVKKQFTKVLETLGRDDIKISSVRSLGYCDDGPVAVIYPDGVWYDSLTPCKAERIAHQHLDGGEPVRELVFTPELPSEYTHFIICTFLSACGPQGGGEALRYFDRRAQERSDVLVTQSHGCLLDCSMGPLAIVYPQGTWYADLCDQKYKDIWTSEVEQDERSRFSTGAIADRRSH